MTGINETLAERAKTYGNFAQEAVLVETIKKALRAHPKWDYLPEDCKLALEMITLKQVRAVNNFIHIDNWHDIGGYAKLIENRLEKQYLDHKDKDIDKPYTTMDKDIDAKERSWPWEPASNLLQKEKKKEE